jgi:tetratricopeptide (TPR) repeat protein
MSEMLGNRYFIARQFEKAYDNYQQALKEDLGNLKIKKKLVICSIQIGQIDQAMNYFYDILQIDPYLIIKTDPYLDDCPCPEIIPSWESKELNDLERNNICRILGMLYLYCDLNKSIEYFQNCMDKGKNRQKVMSILKILTSLEVVNP